MDKNQVARLESRIDYLEAEFQHLDTMLKSFGFDDGIKTLAETLDEAMEIDRLFKSE